MRIALAFSLLLASAVHAQGTIAGVVLDPAGHPVRDADVMILGEKARGRTDSTGRFTISNVDKGYYHVRARRIGFLPSEVTTDLSRDGKVELTFELKARPAVLDSVVVLADGRCPDRTFVGYYCRKRTTKGVFLSDDDLADRGAIEVGDIFRDVTGFRIETIPTNWGPKPRPLATRGARCLNALVNGQPLSRTNPLPRYAIEVIAVEIYAMPNDVPSEFQRYVSMQSARQTSSPVGKDSDNARCSLAVYWTQYY
jgi:hypothetical protein